MRHRFRYRQLNKSPAHRISMFKTMATQLVLHERIFTTLARAKELRPLIEKLVIKAKRNTREDNLFLKQNLRRPEAIKKLKEEIAPRFRTLPAGFTRVEAKGSRQNDKAEIGMI